MKKESKEKVVIIPRPPAAEGQEAVVNIAMKSMPVPPPQEAAPAPSAASETPVAQACPEPASIPRPKPIKDLKKRPLDKEGLPGAPIKK